MTTLYAVKVDATNPYFDDPEAVQYLAQHEDPAIPYRKLQTIPAGRFARALVKSEDAGPWEPVESMDVQWIALLAKHEILSDNLYGRGDWGWARCTCGWRGDVYTLGSFDRVKAQAEQHMGEVKTKVKELRDGFNSVVRQVSDPVQAICPHRNTEISDDFSNPDLKTWHCRDCQRRVQYVPSAVGKGWTP